MSRTLLDRSTGTVTLFAFDEDQGLSPHTSPYDALVQVLEGEASITIAGKVNRVKGGELILIPARQPHAVKAVQKFKMLLIMIRVYKEKQGVEEEPGNIKLEASA